MPLKPDPSTLLGGLSIDAFLAEYWQRRPLLVRGALPDFRSPLTPEELAGLACEPEVPARLVLERGGAVPWELRHGPFTEAEFRALPSSHYSLLVTDCEKLLPELGRIVEPFRFIPDWRIDDLMISYAPTGGSVGPHVDQYDVFLLQGLGRRRWQIAAPIGDGAERLAGTELDILARFEPDEEWVLSPGDLLYLPPGVPHHGVALDPCMTYSIGFRAPSWVELVTDYCAELTLALDEDLRYGDPDLERRDHPGRITEADVDRVEAILAQALRGDRERLRAWLGRYLTERGPQLDGLFHATEVADDRALQDLLRRRGGLRRNPAARFAFMDTEPGPLLFVDGRERRLDPALRALAARLCADHYLPADVLTAYLDDPAARRLLRELLAAGALEPLDG